jgi:hypothetical protein
LAFDVHNEVCIDFDKKRVGLKFGRFFSQTHLVTLVGRDELFFVGGKKKLFLLAKHFQF